MSTLVTVIVSVLALTAAFLLLAFWLLVRGARRLRTRLSRRVFAVLGAHRRWSAPLPPARSRVVTLQAWLPGRARPVAALRRDLHRDVHGAVRAVEVGLEAGRPVRPLAAIGTRLQRTAFDLDVDLAVIAAEPDLTRRRALLDEQADRIQALRHACAQVRRGVLLAGSATTGPLLPVVMGDINDEVVRLDLWAKAHRELQGG
ncbi:MAG: hypothetical protein JWM02_1593 [Frankiales bacterium]|nr:hypothetical protein [Frankiales bacterium]